MVDVRYLVYARKEVFSYHYTASGKDQDGTFGYGVTVNDDDGSYRNCYECLTMAEEYRCPYCGMTGHEIYLRRFEVKTGVRHISHHLEDLSGW